MRLFATLGLSLLAVVGKAQHNHNPHEYVVTVAGDTLRGEVQLTDDAQQRVRLFQPGQPTRTFGTHEVRSYGGKYGLLALSKPVGTPDGLLHFVTPLVQGPVNLYTAVSAQGGNLFYIQPADSAYLVLIPTQKQQQQPMLLRLLPGCPQLKLEYSETLARYPYNVAGMQRLVTAYNACRYPHQASTVQKQYGLRTELGIKAGINAADFSLGVPLNNYRMGQSVGYQAGFFVHFRTKRPVSVLSGIDYMALRGQYGPVEVPNNYAYYTTLRGASVSYSQVQLPLILRYTPGSYSTWQPYFNAGANTSFTFNNQSVWQYRYQDAAGAPLTPSAEPTQANLPLGRNLGLGFLAGVGINWQRPQRPTYSLEVRYEWTSFGPANESELYHQVLRLDLGMTIPSL